MNKTDKFFKAFFAKLAEKDFNYDEDLKHFYKLYKSNYKTNENLLDFYKQYIMRNKEYNEAEVSNLLEQIKDKMLNPTDDNEENPRFKSVSTGGKVKITLDEAHALSVLSEYIKISFIRMVENPDETTQQDEEFHNSVTNLITEEIIQDQGKLPTATQDVEFGARNHMLELWKPTENHFNYLQEKMEPIYNIVKKIFFFDATTIDFNKPHIKTIETDTQNDPLPPVEIMPNRYKKLDFNCEVIFSNNNSLVETFNTKEVCCMINPGSRLGPCGNSDQGLVTVETPLYYCTTYWLSINQILPAYSLSDNQFAFSPKTLVFRDPSVHDYPMLEHHAITNIKVLTCPPVFRPAITSTDLYSVNTRYVNPDIISQHIDNVFRSVLFLGFHSVIFTDHGVEDYHHPVHHFAELLATVVKKYKTQFKQIIFAIDKPSIYKIFRLYIA